MFSYHAVTQLRGHAHSQFPAVTVWGHQLLDHLFAAAGLVRQIEVSLLTSLQPEVISGFKAIGTQTPK